MVDRERGEFVTIIAITIGQVGLLDAVTAAGMHDTGQVGDAAVVSFGRARQPAMGAGSRVIPVQVLAVVGIAQRTGATDEWMALVMAGGMRDISQCQTLMRRGLRTPGASRMVCRIGLVIGRLSFFLSIGFGDVTTLC
jgi:hypothetical protein